MTSCNYKRLPNGKVVKSPVGECTDPSCKQLNNLIDEQALLFDKRSKLCSQCNNQYHWNKLSLKEFFFTNIFNRRWESSHGIKQCTSCKLLSEKEYYKFNGQLIDPTEFIDFLLEYYHVSLISTNLNKYENIITFHFTDNRRFSCDIIKVNKCEKYSRIENYIGCNEYEKKT